MSRKVLGIAAVAAALLVGALPSTSAKADGLFPGLPSASYPLTGVETVPADTHLSSGVSPQSENITTDQLKGYSRTPVTLSAVAAGTVAVDSSGGEFYRLTLGAPGTQGFTSISTPSNAAPGHFITISVAQDSTGSRTVKWQGVFMFGCGAYSQANTPPQACTSTPTLSTTASRVDMFSFVYNGTNWMEYARMLGLQGH